jgi:preprotein translocase SecE subunit
MNPIQFFKEVRAELKHVKWPTRKMVIASAVAVILISIVVAIYLSGLDLTLQKLLAKFVA